ncbi:MAG: hypothetical protein ACE5IC_01990 [Candidatus Brocadiales bacterium]
MAVDSTTWIAISAVVIAVVSLGWNAYNILRDRPKIALKYHKNMKIRGIRPGAYDPDKHYFVMTVINKGRRPVNIIRAGVKLLGEGGKPWVMFSDSLLSGNRILTETKPTTDFFIDQSLLKLDSIDFVWAEDATGRVYKKTYIRTQGK